MRQVEDGVMLEKGDRITTELDGIPVIVEVTEEALVKSNGTETGVVGRVISRIKIEEEC